MAGASGFEPELKVLETRVLPLTPCPYISINEYIIILERIQFISLNLTKKEEVSLWTLQNFL